MEEEQILPDKIEIKLKVDLKVTNYKNEMENDATWTYKKTQLMS